MTIMPPWSDKDIPHSRASNIPRRIKITFSSPDRTAVLEITVPKYRDDEEYINEFLSNILADPFAVWEFIN